MTVRKRSLAIAGHRTSVSLEEPFWRALGEIARRRRLSLARLVAKIDAGLKPGPSARRAGESPRAYLKSAARICGRREENLSSALRIYVLAQTRDGALR